MNPSDNRRFHLLLKECGLGEEEKNQLVWAFSGERTSSSKELNPVEVAAVLRYLQDTHKKRCQPMRNKIIRYLCELGWVNDRDEADYDRINAFIVGMGSNNPRKVILNFLYYSELPKVVTQVEAMYKHESKRVTRK